MARSSQAKWPIDIPEIQAAGHHYVLQAYDGLVLASPSHLEHPLPAGDAL
jgi:hypothetical protein